MTIQMRPWRSSDSLLSLPTHTMTTTKDKGSLEFWLTEGKRRAKRRGGRPVGMVVVVVVVVMLVLVLGGGRWGGVRVRAWMGWRACGRESASDCIPPATLAPLLTLAQAAMRTPVVDWHNLGSRGRLFHQLFSTRYTPSGTPRPLCSTQQHHPTSPLLTEFDAAMSAIESDMYPWLRGGRFGSAVGLVAQYTGSGIVMTTGNFHAKFALLAIGSIRALNCTLPIELFYAGDKDLSGANQALFTRLPAVTLIDISPLLHLSAAEHGWSLKPFAILASSFRHAIFIDADVLFLRSPAEMLTYQLYTTSGTLLFRDRTLYPGKQRYKNFFSEVMEGWTPSAYYADGRVGRDLSLHEGESGVVVMDKVRNFHALLMACKMNSGPWKEDMYIVMHGDKESYWISHELLSHPYRWVPGGGGSIGFLETPPSAAATASSFPAHSIRICGPLFHPSPSNAPLWINGGIVMNKLYDEGKQQMRFTHWAVDRTMRDVRWEWEKVDKPFCLYREDSAQGTDWGRIEAREMGVLDRALEEWETLKEL